MIGAAATNRFVNAKQQTAANRPAALFSRISTYACFAAARFAAHIFFVAAMIAALPAALSLRFGFCACAGAGVAFFGADCAFAALAARAFFRFATTTAFAAAESFRFAFGTSAAIGAAGSDSPLILAHLAFCARAIFRRAAALTFLRLPGVASGVETSVVWVGPPESMARSSAS